MPYRIENRHYIMSREDFDEEVDDYIGNVDGQASIDEAWSIMYDYFHTEAKRLGCDFRIED